MCDNNIDLNSDDVIELTRETEQVKETFLLCINCFQENADHLRTELWNVDEYLEEEEEEEEEEEVYEITIKNKSYYTTNETNGPIYTVLDNEEVGDQIGEFKKGRAVFYRKRNKI